MTAGLPELDVSQSASYDLFPPRAMHLEPDIDDMPLHRRFRDFEHLGDINATRRAYDQLEDLQFACGECEFLHGL